MDRLKDKVAVVTGASYGIGCATAIGMAEEGAHVALLDLAEDQGQPLAANLEARDLSARFWPLDVRREADVARVLDEVAQHFGRIDVLVNNAGVAGANRPTHEISEAEWDEVQAINVKGVFFCTKHAVPHLRRAGGGAIVNISSIFALVGAADWPPYHAAKGAVRQMTKTDALLYACDRIRVNAVDPGFIWTPMAEQFLKAEGDLHAAAALPRGRHPLGHLGEPADVAWGCVYLASDEAKFVTGTELVIDGGYTAR